MPPVSSGLPDLRSSSQVRLGTSRFLPIKILDRSGNDSVHRRTHREHGPRILGLCVTMVAFLTVTPPIREAGLGRLVARTYLRRRGARATTAENADRSAHRRGRG